MNIWPNAFLQRRAIAILTLLAILVAPLCASLCGSRACANLSSTQTDDCHSSLTASDSVPQTGVAAIRVCGSQEFPSAAINEKSNSPERIEQVSAVQASSNFVPAQTIHLLVSDACSSRADNERCIANTSVQSTALRI
jgi:hypothetical protein